MNIHDLYRPFLKYFRTKRMREFARHFELGSSTSVLDVGGDPFNWSLIPCQPKLCFVNLVQRARDSESWVIADGRHLPFKDNSFDIVYSNSVIEHLGNFQNQHLMADECQRVGVRYYVQTPNRRFPVEPHLITPLIHYLPKSIQKRLLRRFTIWGWVTHPTTQQCSEFLQEVRLLNEREMKQIFPNGDIWHERLLGLTKSIIAVKTRPGCTEPKQP